jgi:glycosyltransferase involved in cell wall biosynthesis
MRILLCCESYFPAGGGVARVNQEIAERLAKRGHDVIVATKTVPQRTNLELNGVKIAQFNASGNRVRGLRGETEKYKDFVISGKFDAIFIYAAQQWTFDALWEALPDIKARKVHVPCGYSSQYDPSFAEYFRQMPDILREFDHLIYNASNYRDIEFAKQCGLTKLSIIANGASETEFEYCPIPDFRQKWGIDDNEFIFLTVGSPPSLKGHREVAIAYEQVQLPFPSILILDGKYDPLTDPLQRSLSIQVKRSLVKAAKTVLKRPVFPSKGFGDAMESIARQAHKRFIFSDMPRNDLISAMFSSNLFVFASHVEYSPLVLFESVAAGLPFLSVPVGNTEEIAQWTKGGEICPAEKNKAGYTMVSPLALAEEMSRLAKDPERLSQLGQQGRENWKKSYTWEKIVNQYEDVIIGA